MQLTKQMLCLEEVRGKGCEEVSSLSLLFICQLATEDLFSHSREKWENFELCCHPSFIYYSARAQDGPQEMERN